MAFIYFILVLGTVVFIHESGHFLFAKLFNVYVHEFSIGMGKKLLSFKRKKDETEYNLRLVPIGGFVSLAGEEVDDDKKVPKERKLWAKNFGQRFMIMFAGAFFNFILAVVILFFIGLFNGSISSKPMVGKLVDGYPAIEAGMKENSLIVSINGEKIKNWDDVAWELEMAKGKETTFVILKDNKKENIKITPKEEVVDGVKEYKYGFEKTAKKEYGLGNAFKYSYEKTISLFKMMVNTLKSLFSGKVSVRDLSGPVGIYTVVDNQAKGGIVNVIYLIAFLSINVGFINLLPFPAFDGGRILFLIVEKIKGSPINPKVENTIHGVGFVILMLLMLYVTFNDILRLF